MEHEEVAEEFEFESPIPMDEIGVENGGEETGGEEENVTASGSSFIEKEDMEEEFEIGFADAISLPHSTSNSAGDVEQQELGSGDEEGEGEENYDDDEESEEQGSVHGPEECDDVQQQESASATSSSTSSSFAFQDLDDGINDDAIDDNDIGSDFDDSNSNITENDDYLDQICQYCLKSLDNAVSMNCGHNCCDLCANEPILTCRLCKQTTDILHCPRSRLPPDHAARAAQAIRNKKLGLKAKCEVCEVSTARMQCMECDCVTCVKCCNNIHMGKMKAHHYFPLHFGTRTCELHLNKSKASFCLDCKKTICLECTLNQCKSHRISTLEDAQDELTNRLNEIKTEISKSVHELTENSQQIEQDLEEVSNWQTLQQQLLDECVERTVNVLTNLEKDAVEAITAICLPQATVLETKLNTALSSMHRHKKTQEKLFSAEKYMPMCEDHCIPAAKAVIVNTIERCIEKTRAPLSNSTTTASSEQGTIATATPKTPYHNLDTINEDFPEVPHVNRVIVPLWKGSSTPTPDSTIKLQQIAKMLETPEQYVRGKIKHFSMLPASFENGLSTIVTSTGIKGVQVGHAAVPGWKGCSYRLLLPWSNLSLEAKIELRYFGKQGRAMVGVKCVDVQTTQGNFTSDRAIMFSCQNGVLYSNSTTVGSYLPFNGNIPSGSRILVVLKGNIDNIKLAFKLLDFENEEDQDRDYDTIDLGNTVTVPMCLAIDLMDEGDSVQLISTTFVKMKD